MEKLKIQSHVRDPKTVRPGKLLKQGEIPAILYGHNVKNQALAVNAIDFEKAFKAAGESTIVDLVTEEGKSHSVLIQDVQYDNVTSRPLHIDFYEVSMTEKLKANVALEFVGESKAVKELGGVLVKVLDEVEVECLPADLPHNFEVNISALDTFNSVIAVKDLKTSPKVKILVDADELIVKVQSPRDVEKELETVAEDVSKVEGAAEEKPAAPGEGAEEKSEADKK